MAGDWRLSCGRPYMNHESKLACEGNFNAVLVLVEVFGVDGCDAGGVGVTGVGAGDMLICWPGVVAVVAVVAAVLMGT